MGSEGQDRGGALAGRTILVTRARHQAGKLAEELRARGATVVEIPAIEIVPPESYAALDAALANLSQYQWLVVTSANTARVLQERGGAGSAAGFAHVKIAAVGPGTAAALRDWGLEPSVTPREYVAEGLVEGLGAQVSGQRVLLARAAVARDVIPDALRARGAQVEVVEAYRTVIPAESVTMIGTILGGGGSGGSGGSGIVPDAVTFTSSSTVTNFLALLREAGLDAPRGMRAVSIGPITSATLWDAGWEPAAEGDPHDLAGLVEAVVRAVGR